MPQLRIPIIALAGAALAVAVDIAAASTCYVVLDAKDTIVYQASMPPVDMSDRGAAARDALRQRGNYLLFMETERCVPIGFDSGEVFSRQSNTGSITAVDEGAVARAPGIQPAKATSGTPPLPVWRRLRHDSALGPIPRPQAPLRRGLLFVATAIPRGDDRISLGRQ